MLISISGGLTELRTEFGVKIESLRSESKDQLYLLRSIKDRLISLGDRIIESPPPQGFIAHENQEARLLGEIKLLQSEVQRLKQDNESLRNFRVPQFRLRSRSNQKFKEFEMLSHTEKSFSPIASPFGEKHKKKVEQPRVELIREFRLDSEFSKSHRPAKELLADPRAQRALEDDQQSVKTSRGAKGGPKPITTSWHFLNPLKLVGKNVSSVLGDSHESISGDNADRIFEDERPSLFDKSRVIKPASFYMEERSNSDGSDARRRSIKNIRNFDDFQAILRDLKKTLNASTYASFNENIDDNIKILEDHLKKYSILDDQILQLYHRSLQSLNFEKRASVRLEMPPFDRPVEQTLNRSHSFVSSSSPSQLLRELQMLKNSSNLMTYEAKIKEIQANPAEFESFIYKIKQELQKREQQFNEIQANILIN